MKYDLSDITTEFEEDTVKKMIHAIILKIPIIVIQDPTEKVNKANLLNLFFTPILPESNYESYIPFYRLFDPKDIDFLGVSGIILNKSKSFSKIFWNESTTYAFEEHLISIGREFLDSESQQIIMQSEFNKLISLFQLIEKKIDKWGSISGDEILQKIPNLKTKLSESDLLIEILEILWYLDYVDLKKILVNKKAKRVVVFYHDLLKQSKSTFLQKSSEIDLNLVDKSAFMFLIQEFGESNFIKILHSIFLKIPISIIHDPYEKLNLAKKLNQKFISLFPKELYQDFIPFNQISDPEDINHMKNSSLLLDKDNHTSTAPWIELSYGFEEYLVNKFKNILDFDSQMTILKIEFENLVNILGKIKKKIDLWGSISDREIIGYFHVFNNEIPDDFFLIEILQIMKYLNYGDIKKVLINKSNKKVNSFYHKLLKKD